MGAATGLASIVIVVRAWREDHPSYPFRAVVRWTVRDASQGLAEKSVKSSDELFDEVRSIIRRLEDNHPRAT